MSAGAPTWLATREENGATWFRLGRAGDRLVAEWPGLCVLESSRDGSDFELRVDARAQPAEIEKIRRGAAYALVQRLRGKLAFHASAIAIDGAAFLAFGRAGAGKSTFAASMTARGAELLADDIAVLSEHAGEFFVEPTERAHWLVNDAARSLGLPGIDAKKSAFPAKKWADSSMPLRGCICLAFDGEVARVERREGLAIAAELFSSIVRFVVDDVAEQRRETDALLTFATRVPFFTLSRPRDLRALDETARLAEGLAVSQKKVITRSEVMDVR